MEVRILIGGIEDVVMTYDVAKPTAVVPAKAGTHNHTCLSVRSVPVTVPQLIDPAVWVPAFAGTTAESLARLAVNEMRAPRMSNCTTGNSRRSVMRKLPVALRCRTPQGLPRSGKSGRCFRSSCSRMRGVSRPSRDVGCGMRWACVAAARVFSRGRTAMHARSSRVVLTPRCWCHRGGAHERAVAHGGQQARRTREIAKQPLKPIAQGRPGASGCTCGTCRLHSFRRRAAGVSRRLAFPVPSVRGG